MALKTLGDPRPQSTSHSHCCCLSSHKYLPLLLPAGLTAARYAGRGDRRDRLHLVYKYSLLGHHLFREMTGIWCFKR